MRSGSHSSAKLEHRIPGEEINKDAKNISKTLYNPGMPPYNAHSFEHGGIAQLGERLHGMQEVSGSIPLTSTKRSKEKSFSPGPHRLEA